MRRVVSWFKRLGRKAQTTSEYVIILGLVALGSIAVILIFGNQVRELFRAGTHKMADEPTQVRSYADEADREAEVDGMADAFGNQ
jgi:Flp pilus assembly pilin Flp